MKKTDCIVAGGGFPGIYAAWHLARQGKSVCLIEASDSLGGIMKSRQWNGYWLDNGTHNLDLRSDLAYEFYSDILQGEFNLLENHDWASTIEVSHTQGFEMPDFSIDDSSAARRALNEITKLEGRAPADINLAETSFLDWYQTTYGASLTASIRPMLEKMTGGHSDAISALGKTSLALLLRPKLADDAIMLRLKSSSNFFNDRMGVTRHCGDDRFTGSIASERFAYPSKNGLGNFCNMAEKRLSELGVDIQFHSTIDSIDSDTSGVTVHTKKQSLSGKSLLWTLADHYLTGILNISDTSAEESLPVGYCIYAFEIKGDVILGPDYLHDYSESRIPFRYSRPAVYSGQAPKKNHTVIMAEVPCHPRDQAALMESSMIERVWQDCISSGYIKSGTKYKDSCSWNVPVAFTLPSCSWNEAYNNAKQQRETMYPRIIGIEPNSRGRTAFIHHFNNQLGALLQ